jgi:hypothetical protein
MEAATRNAPAIVKILVRIFVSMEPALNEKNATLLRFRTAAA